MVTKAQLVFIPLFLCTLTSFTPEKEKNIVYFKGNEIAMGTIKVMPYSYLASLDKVKDIFLYTALPDSVPVKDWVTGHINMEAVQTDIIPVAINGKPIIANEKRYYLQSDAEVRYMPPVMNGKVNSFDEYLFTNLKTELDKLDDGAYAFNVNKLVVDDAGNIAYYEAEGISVFMNPHDKKVLIREDLRHEINNKLIASLEMSVKFKPALKDSKPVNTRLNTNKYMIQVSGHKAQLVERGGC
jgi:hypothetical protein